jgi:hypothetical protein
MSEVTFYIALAFVPSDDGIASGEAIECFNPNSAVMKAEALSRKRGCGGAVAISRSGDPATGDFGDARLRAKVDDLCRERDALRQKRSSVARLPHGSWEEAAQHRLTARIRCHGRGFRA